MNHQVYSIFFWLKISKYCLLLFSSQQQLKLQDFSLLQVNQLFSLEHLSNLHLKFRFMIFMKYREQIMPQLLLQPKIRLWLLFESWSKLESMQQPRPMLEIQLHLLLKHQLEEGILILVAPYELHCEFR